MWHRMENKKAIMTGEITTTNTAMWRDKNNNCRQNNLPAATLREQDEMNLLKSRPCHSFVKTKAARTVRQTGPK
jgi:flavoprotein